MSEDRIRQAREILSLFETITETEYELARQLGQLERISICLTELRFRELEMCIKNLKQRVRLKSGISSLRRFAGEIEKRKK